jgi:fatty acid desaturase
LLFHPHYKFHLPLLPLFLSHLLPRLTIQLPLFLNNNFHLVHHKQPHLPWYVLPSVYRAGRAEWLALNEGYAFSGYRAVMRAYALRAKEPVVHPANPGVIVRG